MDEFVPDIEGDFPVEVLRGNLGDDHYLEFRLGYLLEKQQMAIMSVALVEGASFLEGYSGIFDLRFGIRLKSLEHEWNVTPMDYSQNAKRLYIYQSDRSRVSSLLLRAVAGLVRAVVPAVITMSTFDSELPEQALVKYRAIEACLNEAGYRTERSYRSDDGKDRWHFVAAA